MPSFDFGWAAFVPALGFLLQMGLAVAIYSLAPRDARHRALAMLLAANGTWDLIELALEPASASDRTAVALVQVKQVTIVLSVAGLAAFASVYPTRSFLARQRWAMPALAVATTVCAALAIAWPASYATWSADGGAAVRTAAGPMRLVQGLWFPLLALACGRVLWHSRRQQRPGRDVGSLFVALALIIYPLWSLGISAASGILYPTFPGLAGRTYEVIGTFAGDTVSLLAPILLAGIVALAWRVPNVGHQSAVLLGLLGIMTFLAGVAGRLAEPMQVAAYGVSSMAFGGILAYALAKHKLFGIEAKLRWGISKSTIAAIFIAVFFVASEAAQQFFGERTSSTYIGIGLAGTLVFAMAPLQRVAEKFAEKAVPIVEAPAGLIHGSASSRKHDVYRDALGVAFRDRRVTRDEEVKLARLAQELGIGAGEAIEMMHAAEQQTTRKGTRAVKR